MKSPLVRLLALAAGIAVVVSCDSAPMAAPLGSTGSTNAGSGGKDVTAPSATIDTPSTGALANIGDSVLVTVHLHDDRALGSLSLTGYTESGRVDLGTFQRTVRYTEINVPVGGLLFRPGLRDTTIRRYLQPAEPVDTTIDSLVIVALVADSAGNVDSTLRTINIVSGPRLTITSPAPGDSVPAGVSMTAAVHATSNIGVARMSLRVQGETNWPTKFDTTITQTYALPNNRDVVLNATVRLPQDAPVRGKLTVTASGADINNQPGTAASVVAYVRSGSNAEPKVYQVVPARLETSDTIHVSANGDGIVALGFVVLDSTGARIKRDSVVLAQPYVSNASAGLSLGLTNADQGQRVMIYSFAVDQQGRTGYSLRTGTNTPNANEASAASDSSLIVYGHTYALPQVRPGLVADLAVDQARGNVFLSNTKYNLLEVWQDASKSFDSLGVAVGSQPWGLSVSNNPDTLLVANSGATTISRVFIGSTSARAIHEDLANRIRTRNTFIYQVTETRDASTGKTAMSVKGPISYSDRPEFVAQSKGGRIYYSTMPTASAPAGTIRWLDPTLPAPDPQQVYKYGAITPGEQIVYALFNTDSVGVAKASPSSNASDTLVICDHKYGSASVSDNFCLIDTTTVGAVQQDSVLGGDALAVLNLDVASLAFKDTTFAAASGDRSWIGFGEGDTKSATGRVVMVNDPNPGPVDPRALFTSPNVTVGDLTENASERVSGIAIDSTGLLVAAHGQLNTYVSYVDNPFHLRLAGEYAVASSVDGGVAFDPSVNGEATPAATRIGFTAVANNQIDIFDAAQYANRGVLQLKNSLYGPLRVSRAMPGDPAGTVLKLFAMTDKGLVVIDLSSKDIKPAP
ncbi:MAG: hypothetical protein KGL93_05585 [Gemmatimonadota bacterium]|nr:hypothetical protein [Gemmatimonadota bacterium]HEU4988298.1 hypothetical protein [Gemmatimonadaceae bacterium]